MRFVSMEQARPQATVPDACGLTACEAENDLKPLHEILERI
jgi:hypothetical protein